MKARGYVLFSRPYELNIIGVRNEFAVSNSFDDLMFVFRNLPNGTTESRVYPCTTDTGTYYLENPMMNEGAAMLAAGQHLNAYDIGLHRGIYRALVQVEDLPVFRVYDRGATLGLGINTVQRGRFGINIHRAAAQGTTRTVEKYSAGCQVLQEPTHFAQLMEWAAEHRSRYGRISYTLLDRRAEARRRRRNAAVAVSSLALAGFAAYEYRHKFSIK
jgi:hypothetical protein